MSIRLRNRTGDSSTTNSFATKKALFQNLLRKLTRTHFQKCSWYLRVRRITKETYRHIGKSDHFGVAHVDYVMAAFVLFDIGAMWHIGTKLSFLSSTFSSLITASC